MCEKIPAESENPIKLRAGELPPDTPEQKAERERLLYKFLGGSVKTQEATKTPEENAIAEVKKAKIRAQIARAMAKQGQQNRSEQSPLN